MYFPGLPDHPGHDIARRQMTGFGGMVSFELDGTVEEVVSFVSSRRFFTLGESLGGVKALLCHPARMTHASIPGRGAREARAVGHAGPALDLDASIHAIWLPISSRDSISWRTRDGRSRRSCKEH